MYLNPGEMGQENTQKALPYGTIPRLLAIGNH